MPQSSLTAWLKKPAAVTKPQPPTAPSDDAKPSQALEQHKQDLHSPPQESQDAASDHAVPTAPAFSHALPPLPPQVTLRKCTKADIPTFKRLNTLLLPIPYPESFYREIIEDPLTNNITLLAFWKPSSTAPNTSPPEKNHNKPSPSEDGGKLVGAIRCRILAHPPGPPNTTSSPSKKGMPSGPMLYLSTLVLLSPYRSHGIASHLLQTVLRRAVDEHKVTSVGAHVWVENHEGLEWYRKRGFVEVGREEGYYRRLKPQGAVVMMRRVGVGDLLGD